MRWRPRLFLILAALMLALPGALSLKGGKASTGENRVLATMPPVPADMASLLALPGRLDAVARDRVGLRKMLVVAQEWLRWRLFHEFAAGRLVAGREGRVFLGQHGEAPRYSLIDLSCGIGFSEAARAQAASDMAALFAAAERRGIALRLLLAPSSAALYPDQLPPWLAARCARTRPPGLDLAAALPDRVTFPLAFEQGLRAQGVDTIPLHNFHWDGEGPQRVVAWYAETRLGLKRIGPEVPGRPERKPSDVGASEPGVPLDLPIFKPDFAAAGIALCRLAPCFAEHRDLYEILNDVSISRRTDGAAGPRILILSDSYGIFAAPYFAQYASEVRHVSANETRRLTPAQLETLRHDLFDVYQPDLTVLIYHDGNVPLIGRELLGSWFLAE